MKVYLRPISINDTQQLILWRNSEKVREHCFSKKKITEESHKKYYEDFIVSGRNKQFIVERVDEEFGQASYPIATVYLKDIDVENRRCELCVFTSNDEEWIEESQILAIKMLLDKAFCEYNMHKVYSYVFKRFPGEIQLLLNSGFEIEAEFKKEAVNYSGQYEDVLRMCVLRDI